MKTKPKDYIKIKSRVFANLITICTILLLFIACSGDSNDNPSDDVPGDSSTSTTVTVGGSIEGSLENSGDQDWFRVALTSGNTYYFDLKGLPTSEGTLANPKLTLYGIDGSTELASDNDGGEGNNSHIAYMVPADAGGTYYIAAGRPNDRSTGSYTLSVAVSVPFYHNFTS